MRKRNTPIRMITVRPAQPRRRMVLALARRFGIGTDDARREAENPYASAGRECRSDGPDLDLDQRVRLLGEW
ncbi:short-chain dehydrogenase [Variovorax sp. KBW07]|uniref:short-chain dehydrogenase n=1 Tax=Variovorax sp. KBW07 TaxID=2153358 RepID=UPI000F57570D|nr:short-chain dehydrogenase [Variovorax sp. KBW07]RQO63745.1 short-chain dehydrogenase [Variovorax sp. KBW07]